MISGVIGGRFRVLRELGRGGMGVVYLVREEGTEREVALKVLLSREFSESALRHFEQEFRTLTGLAHPNLTEVYDFGRLVLPDSGREAPFFTMEFVDGRTLDRHLEPGGHDFTGLVACLAQVAQALAYLHAREVVHQDVKPSNILVAGGDPPRVKLMDLGLAGRAAEGVGVGTVRGTVAYLAPEAARGGTVDPRSDLYSLGCVAYEMVAGRPPFRGSSALGVLRSHLEEPPLPPSTFNREVPPALEALIVRLLAKDPGQRPATAVRLLEELSEAAGGALAIETPEIRRHRVLGSGFTGRGPELAQLDRLLENARRGTGRLALLVGEAGVGKSRLLREFQVRCQLRGLDVFMGRAGAGAASSGAFAQALERALRSRGPLSDKTEERHGDALRCLLGTPATDGGGAPEREAAISGERFGLLAAVSAAVEDLARDTPLVLALDDLQHAEETTCSLLAHLSLGLAPARASAGTATPLLLLGAYRAEEVSRASPLFELLDQARNAGVLEEIALEPLGPEETGHILRAMLGAGEIPGPFLERVLEETRGNPLHLQELIATLAEEGHVEPGSTVPPDAEVLERVELPGKVRDLLRRRIARLEEEPRRLLQAASVLGGPGIDPDAVAGVTGMRWESVVRLLLELLKSGLVEREEEAGGAPVYELTHRSLAPLAAETLDDTESGRLHKAAVTYLEKRGVVRRHGAWADFAHHAEAAGQPGRAAEAYARAGDLAQEIHAHREATELHGRSIELVLRRRDAAAGLLCDLYERRGSSHARLGDLRKAEEDFRWMLARAEKADNAALRARAHVRLGNLLADASRYAEATDSLDRCLEIAASDDAMAAQALCGLGRVAAKLGHFDDGTGRFDEGIERARRAGRIDLEVEALIGKGMLFQEQGEYRSSLECFERAAERSGSAPSSVLQELIQESSALALEVQGRHREAIEAYARARDEAQERGDIRATADLGTRLGTAFMRVGDHDRARQELERALALQRRSGSKEGTIQNLHNLAVLHIHRGRYERALEPADEARQLARSIGKRDLLATAENLIGRVHLRLGDLQAASMHLEEAHGIMRDIRSQRWLAVFLLDLGDLRRLEGAIDESRKHYQESAFLARKVGDRRLESRGMTRLGEAHLEDKDYERARAACRKATGLIEGAGLPREEADALMLRSRVELARPGGDVVRAEIDANEALKRYRDLREPEQVWQAEHAVARAALRRGRRGEAAERIGRAHRYLERVREHLGDRWRKTFLEDPRRRELYEDRKRLRGGEPRARREPSPGAPATVPGAPAEVGVDSLKRLLEINRKLNSTRDADELIRLILNSAVELTGAERGFLLLQDGSELVTRQARGATGSKLKKEDLALSRSIARRTMETGQPLLSLDAEADDRFAPFESVHDLRIRSVLAVPLRIQDEIAGAIYLDHRVDRELFSDAHLDLASNLADQAALALHNARMVREVEDQSARLERLNRELERTVRAQREELATAREELSFTRSSLELRYRFEEMVGASQAMQQVYHLIERVAPKKLLVLVTGESGTGKELIARALHSKSDRSGGPFLSVNCAALPENLLESEMFGYRRGAFTGAERDKPGYFELAHGGTLFLDEIGEMGPSIQAKVLRAIERGEVMPVGGKSATSVDVRIVTATNRDLQVMLREGKFREDLFYRINVARIHVPPLRDRRDDIPLLVDHFLGALAEEEKQPKREIEPAALRKLASLPWPGNVRELQHQILRVATFARGSTITLRDLDRYGDVQAPTPPAAPSREPRAEPTPDASEVESLEELERKQILRALETAGGNKTRAAEILGINRATLFRKLKRLGL